jgi:aryl-alcohol dehydrogenase-like predicted oxidoreductase
VPRSDYVLISAIFWGKCDDLADTSNISNGSGISRKRLVEGLNRSLKNMAIDYVDILLCERYDENTPTLEVVQTIKMIIESGKALYWGTSTWPPVRLMEAVLLCDIIGCPRPILEQCEYSMLVRYQIERDYVALFDDYGIGTTIWSPLASGILTGKYNDGFSEGSRLKKADNAWVLEEY